MEKREYKEGEDDRRNEENGKTCGKCEKKSKEHHIECKVCELNFCEKCSMMDKTGMNEQKQQIDQMWICVKCDYQQKEIEKENEKRIQKEKEEPRMGEPRMVEPRIKEFRMEESRMGEPRMEELRKEEEPSVKELDLMKRYGKEIRNDERYYGRKQEKK
ncbi:unnamed protein product [Meganyctiphanes norvegica]|uniref:Zinc-finger domain-containing protein n=1 Tax=Meganyctiphanes norvegica TaxID=48144 RepID=A0AAV2R4P6_MEGNR